MNDAKERKRHGLLLSRGFEVFAAAVISLLIILVIHAVIQASGDDTPSQGTREEAVPIGDPALRHASLKELMLRLTNERREDAELRPVRMGTNPAAQLHAENSLKGCYISHWDHWELKPNHRYTLASGAGTGGENVRGATYCAPPAPDTPPSAPCGNRSRRRSTVG